MEVKNTMTDHFTDLELAGIPLFRPPHPQFDELRSCFVEREASTPAAIARPRTAEQVQVVVRHCLARDIDFVVRAGGHDCAGRSQVAGALTLDVRELNSVKVGSDRETAVVGGGALLQDVSRVLGEEGLVTPVGTVGRVGYVGWATLGGYGPLSGRYGLGVDQILGAKLVNAQGEVVEADEDLLKGIRGGGGIFGVIVELTVKVYPLKQVLFTFIFYQEPDITTSWTKFTHGYESLIADPSTPLSLGIQAFGIEFPGLGKVVAAGVLWADDDHSQGKEWIDRAARFATHLPYTPAPMSLEQYVTANDALLTYPSYGRAYTANIRAYTPRTAAVLGRATESLPGGGIALSVHALRRAPAAAAAGEQQQSVFGARESHLMVECVAMTGDAGLYNSSGGSSGGGVRGRHDRGVGARWADAVLDDLAANDGDNVLASAYVALLGKEADSRYEEIYGEHYEDLVAMKGRYDPGNVFKYAVPRLLNSSKAS